MTLTNTTRLLLISCICIAGVARLCRANEIVFAVYNINEPDEDGSSSRRVFFWTDISWQGDRYALHLRGTRCYRISQSANNQFSSVNTNGECVELYSRDDCSGAMYRMKAHTSKCHRNLGDCDLNDRISSVRLCR